MNKKKVFISYTSSSDEIAKDIYEQLKRQGFLLWKDTNMIHGGQDWRNEIDIAILASDALLVLITVDSMQSHYVTYEWAYALGLKKIVIPILIEDCQIHSRLKVLQRIDFREASNRYDKLFNAIRQVPNKKDNSSNSSQRNVIKQNGNNNIINAINR